MKDLVDIVTNSYMQQKIAIGKSSLYSIKSHIVLQNTSNNNIYSTE